MKTLKFIPLVLLIMTLVSFTGTPISIASSNDDNHLSQNDSIYAPPGYMNKEIQQARTLTDKYLNNQNKVDNRTETLQADVSRKVEAQAKEQPKPVLKQKQSSGGSNKKQVAGQSKIVDSSQYNVSIGTGTDQIFINQRIAGRRGEFTQRLISEVFEIDGKMVRHIYACFDNVGTSTINQAIVMAGDNDIVMIRGRADGSSNPYTEILRSYNNSGTPRSIKIYGGYNEYGVRDLTNTPTVFSGGYSWLYGFTLPSELNGVQFKTGGLMVENSNMNIKNCIFNGGLGFTHSQGIISNNTFNGVFDVQMRKMSGPVSIVGNTFTNELHIFGVGEASLSYNTINLHWIYVDTVKAIFQNNNINSGSFDVWNGGKVSSNNDYYSGSRSILGDVVITNSLSNPNSYINNDTKIVMAGQKSVEALASQETAGLKIANDFNNEGIYSFMTKSGPVTNALAGNKDVSGIFRALLADKNMLGQVASSSQYLELVQDINADALRGLALSLPQGQLSKEDAGIAMRLANILNNSTECQKIMLDSVRTLLADIDGVDKSGNQSSELKKETDDLLQVVASMLLAQAVPDLLNKGDVANVKAIFSEFDQARAKIMLDYSKSTKPYYENMIKDLAKNMSILQLKNLLNVSMTKEELFKLPPSELDKILEKIKNMKDRSFEEEYLLQQEQKYRKDYLDPSKKKMEGDMRGMLKSFTERLNDVLKSTEKK